MAIQVNDYSMSLAIDDRIVAIGHLLAGAIKEAPASSAAGIVRYRNLRQYSAQWGSGAKGLATL